jgi:hypothetical protein
MYICHLTAKLQALKPSADETTLLPYLPTLKITAYTSVRQRSLTTEQKVMTDEVGHRNL